jgi:hypothetical protein
MKQIVYIIALCLIIGGCSSKSEPRPTKDYQLEALQNEVRQVSLFIDNWTGYDQAYSRINSLEEYKRTKARIFASQSYAKLTNRLEFEQKIAQFEAIVKRHESWLKERKELLGRIERYSAQYRQAQQELFAKFAKPLRVGAYELVIANAYYQLKITDPDQAYASARYVGLKQLNIIAASKDLPLRLPHLIVGDFVVEVRITNRSQKKILRPDGYIVHSQSKTGKNGSYVARSFREYLVQFSDDINNRYEFSQAVGVTNKDSENGVRPGQSAVWSFQFNRDNHPIASVKTFRILFSQRVFEKPLTLSIPTAVIRIPELPAPLKTAQPEEQKSSSGRFHPVPYRKC